MGRPCNLVREKGLFSFYQDDHAECCGIRKIAPLRAKLLTLDAWVTGQRKDQSPGTRSNLPVVQLDPAFARPGRRSLNTTRWPTGVLSRCGITYAPTRCPTTHCTNAVLSPSGANPALKPLGPANMSARGAGGGKRPLRKNAACMETI